MQELNIYADFQDYKESWKFLKKSVQYEDYVAVNIGYYRRDCPYIDRINGKSCVHLFRYDLPVDIYNRRFWVIDWRVAKFKCMYPREHIIYTLTYYDKKTCANEIALDLLNKMHNHCVQLLRKSRQLADLIDRQKFQLFLVDYDLQQIDKLKNEIYRRKTEYMKLRDDYLKLKFHS